MTNVLERPDVWRRVDGSEPIATDLEICVEENGELIPLVFPCRKKVAMRVDARSGRRLIIHPSHWRLWQSKRYFH
jgi:hypothetical protein